jgi:hypothetical protein
MTSGSEQRQRSVSVRVRLSPDEHALIIDKANECGLTLSAFLRAAALGRRTRHVSTSRIIDALIHIGNEQRRIGGLIKHLRGEDHLSANERATLMRQIDDAQNAVTTAIGRVDHARESD